MSSQTRRLDLSLAVAMVLASTILMLQCTSPELSWDEADYSSQTTIPWKRLWQRADYVRHAHGPMAIYLAKIGRLLPRAIPIEVRLRVFIALISSIAIGLLYLVLRRFFRTSRSGALVGSGLLLFSMIRLEETNIVGPHHLMLLCTLGILAFGYQWRNRPTLLASLGLGAIMAFGALSMTYVIPVAICWLLAIAFAGNEWITWDVRDFKVSWMLLATFVVAVLGLFIGWPQGVLQNTVLNDFWL